MKADSIAAIANIILNDPPVTRPQMEVLKGVLGAYERIPTQLIGRQEAAKRLNTSPAALDRWCREGVIKKRKILGKKASGFLLADVENLINGVKA